MKPRTKTDSVSTERSLKLLLIDLENEISDVQDIIAAHEAVEQLMALGHANSQEDLGLVDRSGLASLLSVLNVALRQRTLFAQLSIEKAREAQA